MIRINGLARDKETHEWPPLHSPGRGRPSHRERLEAQAQAEQREKNRALGNINPGALSPWELSERIIDSAPVPPAVNASSAESGGGFRGSTLAFWLAIAVLVIVWVAHHGR